MKLIPISIDAMTPVWTEESLLEFIGQIAGECYNSLMDSDKCIQRALNCIKRGHHSPWEHFNVTLKCTVDRGVSHALVRHRHCAFQQSSTIYQKFDELTFIKQPNITLEEQELYAQIEQQYKSLLEQKAPPHRARDILPNALATNLIITTNMRQWQYMFRRRNGPGDSDNMHRWADIVEVWFRTQYPQTTAMFDTYYKGYKW